MDQREPRRRPWMLCGLAFMAGLVPQNAWSLSVTLAIEGTISSSTIASVPALSPWTLHVLYESTQVPTVTTPISSVYQGPFEAEFGVSGSTVFVKDASLVIVEDAMTRDAITFEGSVSSPLTIVTVVGSDPTSSSLASTDLPTETAGVELLVGGTLTIEDVLGGFASGEVSQVSIATAGGGPLPEPSWLLSVGLTVVMILIASGASRRGVRRRRGVPPVRPLPARLPTRR